jgi:hypothetical protein
VASRCGAGRPAAPKKTIGVAKSLPQVLLQKREKMVSVDSKFRQHLPCTGRFPKPAKNMAQRPTTTYIPNIAQRPTTTYIPNMARRPTTTYIPNMGMKANNHQYIKRSRVI